MACPGCIWTTTTPHTRFGGFVCIGKCGLRTIVSLRHGARHSRHAFSVCVLRHRVLSPWQGVWLTLMMRCVYPLALRVHDITRMAEAEDDCVISSTDMREREGACATVSLYRMWYLILRHYRTLTCKHRVHFLRWCP